jgi:hypothetical protein
MMLLARRGTARGWLVPGALLAVSLAHAQIDVVTERYDDARTGANLSETTLNTSNVNVGSFGKLWSYTVSGSVYAQPLYVRNVAIPGQGTHNVLYVVTMNDMLYAFDADSSNGTPLLSLDIAGLVPGEFPTCVDDALGFNDNIIGNIGVESTPVIDLSTSTIYLLARTETSDSGACHGANPAFIQRLHALDMTTFEERSGSPVVIGGSVPGNGSGSSGGMITFDAKIADQRSSLALSNGRVFIAWAGHSDQFNYHGWVMAYDAATLQQTMIWSAAPDGTPFNGGGVWMAGRAPAVDADGNVYYVTGNGTWDLDMPDARNYGESFVKFGPTPDAPLLDWFTPENYQDLNNSDADLGGSGPVILPGTNLIVSGGKSGVLYLTRTDDLGHLSSNDMNIVQVIDNNIDAQGYQIKGGAVYWNRDGGLGPWMYVWSDECNFFNAYQFNGTDFDIPPVSQSTILSPCGSSGGVLTLSANGSAPGSGIVWSSMPVSGNANSGVHPGMLRAFDADDLQTELWNSEQNDARDDAGNWPKFSPPTVVNGRVYLGSFPDDGEGDTAVNVYGLLGPQPDFTLAATPPNPGANPGGSVEYTLTLEGVDGFADAVHFDAGTLPNGVTATFDANDLAPPAELHLAIDLDASVAPGEYPVTITATSGALSHSVTQGFYVTEAAPGDGVIGIDFVGGGTPLAPIGVAGAVPKPNWNEASGASGNALALVDESGVPTGATVTWSTSGTGTLGLSGDGADFVMMNGYLDAGTQTTTVTVSGLDDKSGGYFVHLYADGSNGASSASTDYALEGSDGSSAFVRIVDGANATFDGTYVLADSGEAGNHTIVLIGGTSFTLTVTKSASGGGTHAPLNGLQIVRGGDRLFANGFD